jgi:hypothetical protein
MPVYGGKNQPFHVLGGTKNDTPPASPGSSTLIPQPGQCPGYCCRCCKASFNSNALPVKLYYPGVDSLLEPITGGQDITVGNLALLFSHTQDGFSKKAGLSPVAE